MTLFHFVLVETEVQLTYQTVPALWLTTYKWQKLLSKHQNALLYKLLFLIFFPQ